MTSFSDFEIWVVIIGLALGTYAIRYSFLGIVGDRDLPPFFERLLRYTAVSVLPALLVPMIVWPAATQGQADPARLGAAALAVVVGVWRRSLLLTIFTGMGSLYFLRWLMG